MIYPGTVFWTRIFEYLWDGLEPNYDAVTIRFANAKVILFCLESNSNTQNFSHLKVSIYKGWHWYVSCRCYSMAFNGNSYQVILVIWKFRSLQCTERLVSLATEQQWNFYWIDILVCMVISVGCGFIAIFEKVWFELCICVNGRYSFALVFFGWPKEAILSKNRTWIKIHLLE